MNPPAQSGSSERDSESPRGIATDLPALARGSMLTLAGSVASSVFGFLLILVIGRGLRSRGAGQVFEVIALMTILVNVAEAGADTGLVRFLARYRTLGRNRDLRRTATIAVLPVIVVASMLAVAMFALAGPVASLIFQKTGRSDGAALIRTFAPFLPFATGLNVVLAGTRGLGTMRPFVAIQNFGVPILRPLLILLVIAAGMGTAAIGVAWGLPAVAGFLLAVPALHALLRRAERSGGRGGGKAAPLRDLGRSFWAFSGTRGFAALITVALGWFDVLLVGAMRSAQEAGVYAAVSRFIGVGTIALQATAFAIAPQISALLAREERSKAADLYRSATGWVVAASWPLYLGMAIFAPLLLRVLGADFVSGQGALAILSLAMLVYVGVGNNKTVLLMAGGSGLNLLITGTWLAISLVLDVLLIPRYGIEGAAVAYAVALVGENLTTTVVVARRTGITPVGRGSMVAVVAAVACYGVLGMAARAVLGASVVGLAALVVVGSALYLVILWRYRRYLDVAVLARVLRRGRRRPRRSGPRRPNGPDGSASAQDVMLDIGVRSVALEARAVRLGRHLSQTRASQEDLDRELGTLTDRLDGLS